MSRRRYELVLFATDIYYSGYAGTGSFAVVFLIKGRYLLLPVSRFLTDFPFGGILDYMVVFLLNRVKLNKT